MINQRSLSTATIPRVVSNQIFGDPFCIHDRQKAVITLKRKFWWFSVIASLNHALNYVVNSYATSLLDPKLGGIILGLAWSLNSVSGLTVATPAVVTFGFKYAMIISLLGYTIQIATLYWAILIPDIITAYTVAILGSVVSGFTSAIWWTAQGVYFDYICVAIDEVLTAHDYSKTSMIDPIRAEIAAHWTFIYQSADIVVFLSLSLIPLSKDISINGVVSGLCVFGVITTFLGFTFESLPSNGQSVDWKEIIDAFGAVPNQLRYDARVSLLAPFVFGFGITTAMFAFYVNSTVISDSSSLGTVSLGFLEAWSYFIAIISAYPYSYISNTVKRGQDWVIQFGSLSFLLCGAIVLGLTNSQLGTWQNILIAKGFYGLGRGVFEGSCRAVYAKMFTGQDLTTAFSGQTLSAGFSGGICFFLFGVLTRDAIAGVTIVNGFGALGTYFILMYGVNSMRQVPWSEVCSLCCCSFCGCQKPVDNSLRISTENIFLETTNTLHQPLMVMKSDQI
jgi:hypothetical protein